MNIASLDTSVAATSNIAASHFTPVDDITVSADDLTKIFDPQGLQNNGGPTETYALRPLSDNPALGRIPLKACHITSIFNSQTRMYTDQRGQARPDGKASGEAMCDIGAYEAPAPY